MKRKPHIYFKPTHSNIWTLRFPLSTSSNCLFVCENWRRCSFKTEQWVWSWSLEVSQSHMPSGRDVHVIVDVTFLVRYPDLSSLKCQSMELCNYSVQCPESSHSYPSGRLTDKICDQKTQGIKILSHWSKNKSRQFRLWFWVQTSTYGMGLTFEVEQRFQTKTPKFQHWMLKIQGHDKCSAFSRTLKNIWPTLWEISLRFHVLLHTLANVPLCSITCAEAKDQTRQVFFKADGFLGCLQVALVCQGPCVEICFFISRPPFDIDLRSLCLAQINKQLFLAP